MDFQNELTGLYQDFNDRNIDAVLALFHTHVQWPNGWEGGYVQGHDQVRAYWLRQWRQIDPKVMPISFQLKPDGRISVGVRQIIKDLTGELLSDSQVIHTYSIEDGKVTAMVIE